MESWWSCGVDPLLGVKGRRYLSGDYDVGRQSASTTPQVHAENETAEVKGRGSATHRGSLLQSAAKVTGVGVKVTADHR